MINKGLTRVSGDRQRLSEEVEEDENVVTVRAGHQFEDVWGRGMTPEDIAIFTEDPEDMYLDGDIESWDEIKPGKYYVWSDASSGEDEPEAYFGKSVDEIPWEYSFAVRSHSNPYDNEGFMLCRVEDLDESKYQATTKKQGTVRTRKTDPGDNLVHKRKYGHQRNVEYEDFYGKEFKKSSEAQPKVVRNI